MKKVMKARKSGFTLVELLIVIMIIAILAGMMMLATGSATDSATATKIINDLRAVKSAALLIYMDNNQSWTWAADATGGAGDDITKSFDRYMDKPLFSEGSTYKLLFKNKVTLNNAANQGGSERTLIGFELGDAYKDNANLKDKLKGNAAKAGLYTESGAIYDGSSEKVYMVLN